MNHLWTNQELFEFVDERLRCKRDFSINPPYKNLPGAHVSLNVYVGPFVLKRLVIGKNQPIAHQLTHQLVT